MGGRKDFLFENETIFPFSNIFIFMCVKSWDEAALVVHRMLILGIQPSEKIVVALLDAALGSGRCVYEADKVNVLKVIE